MYNLFLKEILTKELLFLRKGKPKTRLNKRGDIAIVILVLGVLALLVFGLLSFYLVGEKSKSGGIDSAYYLQEIYNTAESAKFSDESLAYKYGVSEENGKYVLEKVMSEKSGWWIFSKEGVEMLRIRYVFDK